MEGNGLATIQQYVGARRQNLEAILPKSMSVERFTRIALASISKTPKLAECSAESLYISMHASAQLGLEPNGPLGHAFLVPYWNSKKNCYECQFQAGWRGLVALADRTCGIMIEARVVRKGDACVFKFGTRPEIIHTSDCSDGEMTHVYAVATHKDGRVQFEVMSKNEIETIRQRTKSKDRDGNITGPWASDALEMARKTVVKRLCKYLPISPDMADAIDADNRADFEDIPEVASVPTQTRTEQVKQQLKDATPTLPPLSEEVRKASEELADAKQNSEPARRGRKPKEQSTAPTQEHKEAQPSAASPAPGASDKPSGGSPPAATQAAVATPSTTSGHAAPVTTPAAKTESGEVHEEWIRFESSLGIGMSREKFIDSHSNAFYSESLLITEKLKKGMADKKRTQVQWTEKAGRNMILDCKVEE